MKASLTAVRIAPKKANLVAKLVRGMPVLEAIQALEKTNKKAARLLEELLKSAVANAEHNEKQDARHLVIKAIVVNKAQAFNRGVPMARGRVRPMRKFMSHIDVTLGFEDDTESSASGKKAKTEKVGKDASQAAKKTVKKSSTSEKSQKPEAKRRNQKSSSEASNASVSTRS